MSQFIRTIQRYPFQIWAIVSNFGVFTWLQIRSSSLLQQGGELYFKNQGNINAIWLFLKENPWFFLGIAVFLILIFNVLKTLGRLILTVLNVVLLLKMLGGF